MRTVTARHIQDSHTELSKMECNCLAFIPGQTNQSVLVTLEGPHEAAKVAPTYLSHSHPHSFLSAQLGSLG